MTILAATPAAPLMTDADLVRRHAGRDDLFTLIHKALRKELFEVTVQAGSTDWTVPTEVAAFASRWQALLALLHAHTRHEDEHLVRPLDGADPDVAARIDDGHRHLDDLLDAVADSVARAVRATDAADGLVAYRDLNRFVAAYLPHLHDEETVVMPRIWAARTDEEIAATRSAFMATLTPAESLQSLTLMLPAVDRPTRRVMIGRLAATAPAPVLAAVLDAVDAVLGGDEAAELRELAAEV